MDRNHTITSEMFHLLEPDLTWLRFKYFKTKRAAIHRKGNISYSIDVSVKDESIWNGGSNGRLRSLRMNPKDYMDILENTELLRCDAILSELERCRKTVGEIAPLGVIS